jgi:hypothetical protein
MTDVIDELRDWYAAIPVEAVTPEVCDRAVHRGSTLRRRRRTRAVLGAVSLCAAVALVIAGVTWPSHTTRVGVVATTTVGKPLALPIATVAQFHDLELVRAWLAQAITESGADPTLVRVEIARTSGGYTVQATGSMFKCEGCLIAQRAPALIVQWDPATHYATQERVGQPVDLHALGDVYQLEIGHPTVPAPTRPVCGQEHGRPTTITSVTRLDHDILAVPEVFGSPGSVAPHLSAMQALAGLSQEASVELAPKVKATLAEMAGTPNSLVAGERLVWIFSVGNVEVEPEIGLPNCGSAQVIVDATTGQILEMMEPASV